MIVDKILNDIESQEKLASQTTPDPAKAAETSLSTALGETLQKVASQAAPAAGNPAQDLFKLATDMVNSEMEREVKQAALCGRAFAHSAIEEFRTYDVAAKTAAAYAPVPTVEQAVKQAASDPELMKAAELGYADAQQRIAVEQNQVAETKLASVNLDEATLEKVAQAGYAQTQEKIAAEQYNEGYGACMTEVRDRAAEEFIKGAMEVQKLVELSAQQG
jgi:hypothetical protein